jgi:hypothetical protein
MKKIYIIGIAIAAALLTLVSCNQKLLDIPQKGVIAYEEFYKTDADAESALVTAYANVVKMYGKLTSNTPSYNIFFNAPGDELYWGGSKKEDHIAALEINEFRHTFESTNAHLAAMYNTFYEIIYKSNLVIDNFYGENGELADSPVKKRCVAEARVLRAWAHMELATHYGTPPLVKHVLDGNAKPTNSDKEELWKFIIEEFGAAAEDLPARNGKTDKDGAVKITQGAALAFLGKALVLHGDYAEAKTPLKRVIDSGNYDLIPGERIGDLFHMAGDGCEEKIFEVNAVDAEKYGKNGRWDYQANQSLFFRQMSKFPDWTLQSVGWGNNMAPTEKFLSAMLKNEKGSYRQKAWIISYEDLLTEFPYSSIKKSTEKVMLPGAKETVKKDYPADADMTKEEKLMDPRRGLDITAKDLYANCGYYFIKFVPRSSDLNNNATRQTQENKTVIRYAEVLLLYAEACAMSGDDGSGLAALNKVASRAGAPTYASLNMDNVKKEKWFEMAWEGTRFIDLVRWGDAAKELAFRSVTKTPYLRDDFYRNYDKSKNEIIPTEVTDEMGMTYLTINKERADVKCDGVEQSGRPHKAVIMWEDDGWGSKGGGFKTGKHELYPFPFDVVTANPWNEAEGYGIKQNPGWE